MQRYGGPRRRRRRARRSSSRRAGSSWSPRSTASRPAAVPGGCSSPGVAEIKRVYVEPGVPPPRAGAGDRRRAGGRRRARPGTGRSCSTPATEQPEALALYAELGYAPGAGLRHLRLRAGRGVPGQGSGAGSADGGARHGHRDGVGGLRGGRRGDRAGGGRAARAAVPRPGDRGAGGRPARACRCRRPRRTTRPSCAGCGGWSPRWAPCPTRWAACCRRRRCPTRGPTAQQTERVLAEIADGAGGVVLGRAGALVLRDRPDALHVRLDGPRGAAAGGGHRALGRARGTRCAARWRPTTGPGRPTCGTSTAATRRRRSTTTW